MLPRYGEVRQKLMENRIAQIGRGEVSSKWRTILSRPNLTDEHYRFQQRILCANSPT